MSRRKNRYYPAVGRYDLVIAYKASFKDLDFDTYNGDLGVFKDGIFYNMDRIFLVEDSNRWKIRTIVNTDIARKVYKDEILKEHDNHLILKGDMYV